MWSWAMFISKVMFDRVVRFRGTVSLDSTQGSDGGSAALHNKPMKLEGRCTSGSGLSLYTTQFKRSITVIRFRNELYSDSAWRLSGLGKRFQVVLHSSFSRQWPNETHHCLLSCWLSCQKSNMWWTSMEPDCSFSDWFCLRTRCSLELDPLFSLPVLPPGPEAFFNLTATFNNRDSIKHWPPERKWGNPGPFLNFIKLNCTSRTLNIMKVTETITSQLRQAAATHILGAIWVWRERKLAGRLHMLWRHWDATVPWRALLYTCCSALMTSLATFNVLICFTNWS